MRPIIIILFLGCISCKPKVKKENINNFNVDTISTIPKADSLPENFNDFFNKFKSDPLFQILRIDDPLSVIISDEESEEEEKQKVKYVSFNQKHWGVKIKITTKELSKDTINVTLEGNDTGVHIEHFFAKRSDKWHLYQIKNLSD